MGALLTNKIIPVCDRRVILSPAWLASTKQDMTTAFPRGSGAFGGIGYLASR
jgi:hypothetical protein